MQPAAIGKLHSGTSKQSECADSSDLSKNSTTTISLGQEKCLNTSGISPRGQAVLLASYEDKTAKSSIIEIPEHIRQQQRLIEMEGVVVEIGPEAWRDEESPRAVVGDKVMISQYAGALLKGPLDGKLYRMINGRDLFAVITQEKQHD